MNWWWTDDADDVDDVDGVDGVDDVDDVDGGENLSDAIGVLGGGWFSLPLLTGQRRSGTIKMLTNTIAKVCYDIFAFSSYFSNDIFV